MNALALASFTTFGDLLRYLRQRERLTQRDLGQAVGYGQAQINRLESNTRLPDVGLVVAQFIAALNLQDEPEAAARLVELAAQARGEPVPASFVFTRSTRRELVEEISFASRKRRGNLPTQVTSFIGREAEIADLCERLKTTRLLTLMGAGGCGKTRLSLEVAARVEDAFADSVWLAEFASITDAMLVPHTVARIFSLPEVAGTPPIETLANYLAAKQALLILDNCEHLIEACAELAERLLRDCPNVHVLTTSREALRIAGEVNWRVPSLPHEDSVRLFVERARVIRPDFILSEKNVGAIAQICQQLDGIPLAIELAAARLNTLSPEQIVERLSDRFAVLISRHRTAIPRHQTLRATIGWSFDLLPVIERSLLLRLAVFMGGFTVEGAEALFDHPELLDLVSNLVDKSLVIAEVKGDAVRYRMLETIRQFAAEQLREQGEEDGTRDQHLTYFVELSETAEIEIRGLKFRFWMARLEQEHDNLRAALGWGVANRRNTNMREHGLRLAGSLWQFWFAGEHQIEGLNWLGRLLSDVDVGSDPDANQTSVAPASVLAKALYGSCALMWRAGDPRMGEWAERSLALSQALQDSIGIAISLTCLQQAQSSMTGIEHRRQMLEEALERLQAAGHPWGITWVQNLLAWQFMAIGNLNRAKALLEESRARCESLDEQAGVYFALRILTEIALIQEDTARAKDYVMQRLRLPNKQGDRDATFFTLEHQGCIALQEGDHQEAAELFEDCLKFWQESGPGDAPTGPARVGLAHIARLRGDYETAASHLNENLRISLRRGRRDNVASVRLWLGRVTLAQGDGATALTHFKECLEYGRMTGNEPLIALGLVDIAEIWRVRGDAPRAVRLLGFATGYSDKVCVAWKPFEREDYEHAIADARAQLVDPELAAAWVEGQTMTLDEAVALALLQEEEP